MLTTKYYLCVELLGGYSTDDERLLREKMAPFMLLSLTHEPGELPIDGESPVPLPLVS